MTITSVCFGQSDSTKRWYAPDFAKIQFAGHIGFLSPGVGYQFINNNLNTELLYGYLPSSISETNALHQIALKITYRFIKLNTNKVKFCGYGGFTFMPNLLTNNTNNMSFLTGLGSNVDLGRSCIKSVEFYIETGALLSALEYALTYESVPMTSVFSMALGLNFYL